MKPFATIVLVMCIYLSGSDSAGLYEKSVIFPTETDNSFVRLNAPHFTSLTAFTVCFRAATEATRSYSLLSYATSASYNELLIWQENKTELWLYLGSYVDRFYVPEMNSLLRHICVSWESKGGEITVWVNGRRSVRKVGGKGRVVRGSGQFLLGQEQDSVGGSFDIKQSFVGEITDVNMWDRVLKPNEIELISQGCYSDGGNIIDWGSTTFTTGGNVIIKDNNYCTF
ncbi:C-reactive protein-like isoform X1 [Amblyraja radiata]|uniref:C-reactive protein-like isoform X1 n=1 Tax=Amblyraja radiata TaxID=386614 RepID=UPI001403145A|nr:C-reactive protein-like isoform X1 [Amblyraja radiata]